MLLKSFKRRVPRATAIVLQFNNIKRELSCRGVENVGQAGALSLLSPTPLPPLDSGLSTLAIVVTNRDPPPYYSLYFFVIDHYDIYLSPSRSVVARRLNLLRWNDVPRTSRISRPRIATISQF